MPHIDGRSGEVVIRIVYDGAPEAGKTTNVQQLLNLISLQRRGASKSPGTTGSRTEFFDWLDFTGGYLDGRRVRCQLVSVPGQSTLLHRRRYLLETADAIVFVTDSRREALEDSAQNFSTTVRMVERMSHQVPVGVILQANKQDLPDALPPAEVARALGVAVSAAVVGSVASSGDGVMQTFVLAVRMASDRVRALILEHTLPELPEQSGDPEALHSAMLEVEGSVEREAARIEAERIEAERIEAERIEAERIEAERIEAERREQARIDAARIEAERRERAWIEAQRVEAERIEAERREQARIDAERVETERIEAERHERARIEAQRVETERIEAERHEQAESEAGPITARQGAERVGPARQWGQRRNRLTESGGIALPHAAEIASGHVWPPVKGRAAIAVATSGRLSVPEAVRAWAPADAFELLSEDGWILHTTDRWLYSNEPVARRRLLTLVRGLLPRVDAMPEGRAIAVARDGAQWRLWLVTPSVRSLAEEALAAIDERSLTTVMACVGHAVTAARKLSTFGLAREAVPAGSSGLALADGRLVLLALDEGEEGAALEPRDPLADIAALLDEVASEDARVRGWLDAEGSDTIRRAQSEIRGTS